MSINIGYRATQGPQTTSNPPTATDYLVIWGTTDTALVRQLAEAFVPQQITIEGQTLDIDSVEVEKDGNSCDVWSATIKWAIKRHQKITFDTTGGTQHITASRQTYRYSKPSSDGGYTPGVGNVGGFDPTTRVPDLKHGIGWDGEQFNGVDVVIPNFSFTVTMTVDKSTLTPAYFLIMRLLTGRVNDSTFNGFDAGEVLFLGASGGIDTSEKEVEIEYKFACSPNLTGLVVGDCTNDMDSNPLSPGIAKTGWDYIWILFEPKLNDDKKYKEPIGVYVETVYQSGDFSQLGLGL